MRLFGVRLKGQAGFTLIELLVALCLSAIALTALASFFEAQIRTIRVENARRAAQVTARGAMNFIVRNLEQAGRDPGQSLFTAADPALQIADQQSLRYRANLSDAWADTDVADDWEDVAFSYDSGVIWLSQGGGDPIALTDETQQKSYVPNDGLTFTYYDDSGNVIAPGGAAAARASIQQIFVSIIVRGVLPGGGDEPEETLSQSVYLRNVL